MRIVCLLALAASALAAPLAADAPTMEDQGTLQIRLHDRAIGTETFTIQSGADSLWIYAESRQLIGAGPAGDSLTKQMRMVLAAFDDNPKLYESAQRFRGHTLKRSIKFRDTLYTTLRDLDGLGEGMVYARPPGRLFILDGELFTPFVVIGRTLRARQFETWPLTVLALGHHDTLLAMTATDLGADSIRWGSRPVLARKLRLADAGFGYLMWLSPDGRMLRLEAPQVGLRVNRAPPPVKRRVKRP